MHSFEVHSNESACRKTGCLGTEQVVYQVILNMLVTKDIDNKVFDYIDPYGETLASMA